MHSLEEILPRETITHLRFAIGMIGNAAALLLFAAPTLTFRRIIQNKSTGEFSSIPYLISLLNCLLYVWYGLPVMSNGWENLPVVTINSIGIMFELSFIIIYLWFAPPSKRKLVSFILLPAVITFYVGLVILSSILHDHKLRKTIVGVIGLVVCIGMYSSPLVAVKRVIQTKSVEFMPFYLSFFSFLSSLLWMVYGILSWDILLMAPNLLSCPIGLLQLVVYYKYSKNQVTPEEEKSHKSELENNGTNLELELESNACVPWVALDRGEMLKILVDKAEDLHSQAQDFKKQGMKIQRKKWYQNKKIKLVVLGVLLLLVLVIWVSVCHGFDCTN